MSRPHRDSFIYCRDSVTTVVTRKNLSGQFFFVVTLLLHKTIVSRQI
jgi:hypothetical protein